MMSQPERRLAPRDGAPRSDFAKDRSVAAEAPSLAENDRVCAGVQAIIRSQITLDEPGGRRGACGGAPRYWHARTSTARAVSGAARSGRRPRDALVVGLEGGATSGARPCASHASTLSSCLRRTRPVVVTVGGDGPAVRRGGSSRRSLCGGPPARCPCSGDDGVVLWPRQAVRRPGTCARPQVASGTKDGQAVQIGRACESQRSPRRLEPTVTAPLSRCGGHRTSRRPSWWLLRGAVVPTVERAVSPCRNCLNAYNLGLGVSYL